MDTSYYTEYIATANKGLRTIKRFDKQSRGLFKILKLSAFISRALVDKDYLKALISARPPLKTRLVCWKYTYNFENNYYSGLVFRALAFKEVYKDKMK